MKFKNNHKRWTKDEVRLLKGTDWRRNIYYPGGLMAARNWAEQEFSPILGRTPEAIVRKVYRLKLHLRKPYWNS